MANKPKVNVVEVKSAPTSLSKPDIQMGIRDKAAAEAWGLKNGYTTVYFLAKKQKVYADRLQVRVDEQSKAIEKKSGVLLVTAETIQCTIQAVESL